MTVSVVIVAGVCSTSCSLLATLFYTEHIAKSFHIRPVLRDVTFSLSAGENVLLFGRNGCGKTTLLRILAGIMRPEQGRANLNGYPLFSSDSRSRRDMVYLGHRPNLYPAFTARENLELSVRLRRQDWKENDFLRFLERYGLRGRENDPVQVYSEGMLQRLGLIRLELATWQVALLDEPSSALDVDGAELLHETVIRWRSQGRTVLFTSHDMGWGTTHADRALLLEEGVIRKEFTAPKEGELVPFLSDRGS